MSLPVDSPTTDTTPAPPVTPVANPPPVSPAPGLNPEIFCIEDGKTWKSKFHGESGRRQQLENRLEQTSGRMEQQLTDLKGTATEKDAAIARLTAEVAGLQQTAEGIPVLQAQIADLSKQAERAARLGVLMQYPDLLAYQVTETQQPEGGGAPVEVVVRPFLDLIESTTLEGPTLEQSLARLATVLNVQAPDAAPAPPLTTPPPDPSNPIAPGTPPAPTPAGDGDGTPGHWRKEAMKWHGLAIRKEPGPNGEDASIEEARCWDQMRQAVQKEQAPA